MFYLLFLIYLVYAILQAKYVMSIALDIRKTTYKLSFAMIVLFAPFVSIAILLPYIEDLFHEL